MADTPKDPMIIHHKDNLLTVNMPDDKEDHLLLVMISNGEEYNLYLDGTPIDPETGDSNIPEETASDELLQAADDMVETWLNGGWKISTTYSRVKDAVERYRKIRAKQPKKSKPVEPPDPDTEGEEIEVTTSEEGGRMAPALIVERDTQ